MRASDRAAPADDLARALTDTEALTRRDDARISPRERRALIRLRQHARVVPIPHAAAAEPTDVERQVDAALALVREEMLRTVARRGHLGAALHSAHEGYGVLAEELHKELLDAIHANDYPAQVREAVQIAAVAARWPIDLGRACEVPTSEASLARSPQQQTLVASCFCGDASRDHHGRARSGSPLACTVDGCGCQLFRPGQWVVA